jgi:hypothetical protein
MAMTKKGIERSVRIITRIYEEYESTLANYETNPYTKEDLVLNLLTDLLHHCKANEISFMCELDRAREHFTDERKEAEGKKKTVNKKKAPVGNNPVDDFLYKPLKR